MRPEVFGSLVLPAHSLPGLQVELEGCSRLWAEQPGADATAVATKAAVLKDRDGEDRG